MSEGLRDSAFLSVRRSLSRHWPITQTHNALFATMGSERLCVSNLLDDYGRDALDQSIEARSRARMVAALA